MCPTTCTIFFTKACFLESTAIYSQVIFQLENSKVSHNTFSAISILSLIPSTFLQGILTFLKTTLLAIQRTLVPCYFNLHATRANSSWAFNLWFYKIFGVWWGTGELCVNMRWACWPCEDLMVKWMSVKKTVLITISSPFAHYICTGI